MTRPGGQALLAGTYNGTFQVGANNTSAEHIAVDLSSGGAALSGSGITGLNSAGLGTSALDISGTTGAQGAISAIDAAIKGVSTVRSYLGATQNRFEHTINNLNVAIQNTTAANSRIRDTDMAQEMTNFSKSQILVQAGTAMLAQANQSSQGILKLLG